MTDVPHAAAAQRNLSPADTDLIELTLTTIYALDKLLHLLRDRSDNLELLSVRLTWEEKRISAWAELRSLMADLQQFLNTRGRWSPTVYERNEDEVSLVADVPAPTVPSLRRKDSIGSLASIASDSTISFLSFTRSERFKLAESLSHEAAQFASRVSSLRHSKVTAAGKALDKLIDDSRKPVPEVLLDEQDKLEDKGINDMEDVGKFIMSIVMQWKKYVQMASRFPCQLIYMPQSRRDLRGNTERQIRRANSTGRDRDSQTPPSIKPPGHYLPIAFISFDEEIGHA